MKLEAVFKENHWSSSTADLLQRLCVVKLLIGRPLRAVTLPVVISSSSRPECHTGGSSRAALRRSSPRCLQSGAVPGDNVGGRDVKLSSRGGGGPDRFSIYSFRVLFVKFLGHAAVFLSARVLDVICVPNPSPSYSF